MRPLLRSSLSVLVLCFILFSNSFCGIALAESSTQQSYTFNSSRAIPANYNIPLSVYYYNKDTKLFHYASEALNLTDGVSSYSAKYILFDENCFRGNLDIGFHLAYEPTISGDAYDQHVIEFGMFKFYMDNANFNDYFYLSSTAVPSQAYATFNGRYNLTYYDGSVGYDVTKYNNLFSINVPISFSFLDPAFLGTGGFGGTFKISVPGLTTQDLLDYPEFRNNILSYTGFSDGNLEDFSYQIFDMYVDTVDCYVQFSANDNNFFAMDFSTHNSLPDNLSGYGLVSVQEPNSVFNNQTSCNVYSISHYDNENSSMVFMSNGFTRLVSEIKSNLGNVVQNATDNANRIIQNTTQKVDEVKQGVTEVKDSVVETKNSILDLPNKIKDMLIGLVVPDDETINAKYAEFDELLASRFGLIYQSADIIHDFAESFQTQAVMTADTGGIITMPSVTVNLVGTPFTFGGYDVDIIPDGFEFLQQALRLAISMVCTVVFVNMCKNKLEAILK